MFEKARKFKFQNPNLPMLSRLWHWQYRLNIFYHTNRIFPEVNRTVPEKIKVGSQARFFHNGQARRLDAFYQMCCRSVFPARDPTSSVCVLAG